MTDELLPRIEAFLVSAGVSATRFGRTVVHDPRFVGDLRSGRRPRPGVRARVDRYLISHER